MGGDLGLVLGKRREGYNLVAAMSLQFSFSVDNLRNWGDVYRHVISLDSTYLKYPEYPKMSPPNSSTMLAKDLSNHLALVTGATGGIGSATCLALASLGCSVAVHYNSAASTAETLVAHLRATHNVNAEHFQADLSTYDGVRHLHRSVLSQMGPPTILFNNAGLTAGKQGVEDVSDVSVETFEETWRANCGSAYLLTQLCVPAMEKAGWGRVVFCSSVAAFTGGVVGPHYAYVLTVFMDPGFPVTGRTS